MRTLDHLGGCEVILRNAVREFKEKKPDNALS
jgi:hypothetical protein